jgi:hypothetical protein
MVALVVVLPACRPDASESIKPLPSPTTTPREPVLVKGGRVRLWPSSPNVEPEIVYRFMLLTHCGLDRSYPDFDSSFWRYVGTGPSGGINAPPGFGNPIDEGTMTLLDEETAEFRSPSGKVARFGRIGGPIEILACA